MEAGEYVFLAVFVAILTTYIIAMLGGFDRFCAERH